MPKNRYPVFIIIILAVILLPTTILYGQRQINNNFDAQIIPSIDTSDYIPSFYNGALNYNLMIASSKGYSTEIQRLINKGAEIDSETSEGVTPLIFAVSNNRLAAVNTLLYYGPDLKSFTLGGETALHIAAKNRYFEITEALIRAGADIDYPDRHGATPLHYAALYGYLDILDLLIYYDASIDLKSREGFTPLMTACWVGYSDIVDILIQNGANLETRDNEGFTPFLIASYWGDTTIMNLLRKKGVDLYSINSKGHDALTLSILSGHTEATKLLLSMGDKWSSVNKNAFDPYTVAAKYQRKEAISLLKEYNVAGHLKREIDQVSVSLSSRLNLHDLYSGISFTFKEPYLNAGLTLGLDTKLWYTRTLMKNEENVFYQYYTLGSVAYAGLFKEYGIYDLPGKYSISFLMSLSAGYSFGNVLKGTSRFPSDKMMIIPAIAFKINTVNLSFTTGMEYLKTDFYKNGPIWLRIGCSYNFYFDKVRMKVKPIRWY